MGMRGRKRKNRRKKPPTTASVLTPDSSRFLWNAQGPLMIHQTDLVVYVVTYLRRSSDQAWP